MPPADSAPNSAFNDEKSMLTFEVSSALLVMFAMHCEPPFKRTLSLANFATNEDSKHAFKPQLTTAVQASSSLTPNACQDESTGIEQGPQVHEAA